MSWRNNHDPARFVGGLVVRYLIGLTVGIGLLVIVALASAQGDDPDADPYALPCPDRYPLVQSHGPRKGECYRVVFKRGNTYRFYADGSKVIRVYPGQ